MTTDFCCAYCYGEDAQAVWTYHRNGGLEPQRRIVDDPHFLVSLRHCRRCGQVFVSIFTEFVDWEGADPPADLRLASGRPVARRGPAPAVERLADRRRDGDRLAGRHLLGRAGALTVRSPHPERLGEDRASRGRTPRGGSARRSWAST